MRGRIVFLFLLTMLLLVPGTESRAGEKDIIDWKDSISLEEAEKVFDDLQEGEEKFSIIKYVEKVQKGEADFSFSELIQQGINHITSQFDQQKGILFRIMALGILAGIFMNFSDTIGEKSLGETGFYITYTLLVTTVAASFYTAFSVAKESIDNLLVFMKVLIPSFSLSLCLDGGTGSSIAFYETMLLVIALIETVMAYIFLPGVQVYFLLSMMNPLADNHFSRITSLVGSFLHLGIRVLFGVLIGYQGIQGLLLPVMDKVKNNTVLKTAKGLPMVGNTMESVADTLFGSGMLIKSAVGVGGLVCILILCFYPVLKLIVFVVMFQIGGALVQPVSDKRMVLAMEATAKSGKLLLGYVFAGALMFLLSITIVLVSTNIV
ncbi:MAG: stage III sporulation protein AE [Eubacterium sp.]|nr:stage III sporulation protein AE [Eubacterium sp.]